MNKKTKSPKKRKIPALFMRKVLGVNLVRLLERHYRDEGAISNKQRELAKATGMSFSSVQRYCSGDAGASIDQLEVLAIHFDLSVYQLLLPNLDVGNPQIVKGAAKGEQAFYNLARKQIVAEVKTT